jgi:hypothetical protein
MELPDESSVAVSGEMLEKLANIISAGASDRASIPKCCQ